MSLHRLTWQRVWSLAAPKDKTLVSALAWRPDGKQLAVAYDSCKYLYLQLLHYITDFFMCVTISGDLLLVDVENKDVTFSKKTSSKVTSLVWVQQEKPQKKETIDSVLIKVIKILYLSLYYYSYYFFF